MADVSSLALRLLGEEAVRTRLSQLAALEHAPRALGSPLLAACEHWAQVRAVLDRAVAEKRPTLLYGDYDVDGSVASFLLFRHLRQLGVPGNVFLPSRFKHGYGLDGSVLETAAPQGYRTLIALDCGTANLDEVEQARAAGLDVAIIDHHELKAQLPAAPLLNPHLDRALPPLCTAGLVYEVLLELSAHGCGSLAGDELELAGLATLADIVPLEPHNWLLAHEALYCLPQSSNHGLQELVKSSRLHGLDRLTATQVAFQLVPRLNAGGRMRSARLVLDLLGAADGARARLVAQEIERLNEARKLEADLVFKKALLQSTEFESAAGVALYGPDWHIGILGIVAARVAEQTGKPAIILTNDPKHAGLLSGSARSAGGVNLVLALGGALPGLYSHGGHAEAAGLKLQAAQLSEFRAAWSAAVAQAVVLDPASSAIEPLALPEIDLYELTTQFEQDLWRLTPFGPAFPTPRCVLRGVKVSRVNYMGRDKTHLSLTVTDGAREVRIAAFRQSHLYNRLQPGTPVRPVVEIDADNWNNVNTIALRLLAVD